MRRLQPDVRQPMLLAVILSLFPVVLVVAIVFRDLRPWWRDYKRIRALPERALPVVSNEPSA